MKIVIIILGIFALAGIGAWLFLFANFHKPEKILCADCKHDPCTCSRPKPAPQVAEHKDDWLASLEDGKKQAFHTGKPLLVKVGAKW